MLFVVTGTHLLLLLVPDESQFFRKRNNKLVMANSSMSFSDQLILNLSAFDERIIASFHAVAKGFKEGFYEAHWKIQSNSKVPRNASKKHFFILLAI